MLWGRVPGLLSSHAGRIWLVGLCGLAVWGSSLRPSVRTVRAPVLGWIVGLGVLGEAWRWFSQTELPWMIRWGAWWDTGGWWLVALAGTLAVLAHSSSPTTLVRRVLVVVLSVNLLAYGVDWFFGVEKAWWQGSWSGVFPSETSWAAWSVISLPFLWSTSPVMAIPAILGLLLTHSTSAFLAASIWMFSFAPRRQRVMWIVGCAAAVCVLTRLQDTNWLANVQLRWQTWQAVWKTIWDTPAGIGWAYRSYETVLAHTTTGIINNPASDLLMLPLRYGWWTWSIVLGVTWWVWTRPSTPLIWSLRMVWGLAAWSTSVSLPIIGGLTWLLWMTERLGRTDEETQAASCA